MLTSDLITPALIGLHLSVQFLLAIRVLLRPHRDPASRVAWLILIITLPAAGILTYLLFGEVNIGRKRVERMRRILQRLEDARGIANSPGLETRSVGQDSVRQDQADALFQVGQAVGGFAAVAGNRAELLGEVAGRGVSETDAQSAHSKATIDRLVADIDAARQHVHLLFYIWLPDHSGTRVAEALMRAARRGVQCRALVDDLGSRSLIKSAYWRDMSAAGVRLARALPIGNPLLRPLRRRIDLRNHRKIVVIDHHITYCGSQNCADAAFRIKPKFAPWVDAVMRFEGPIARQNQCLFAADWMSEVDEDLEPLLAAPLEPATTGGLRAQVIGTGPTLPYAAMPELFQSLMYAARRTLLITTPYYVPDESMQSALCAAARRGVDTRIIFPARNDSPMVAAASRSYYADLLATGVRVYEYPYGLLHTKSLTLDDAITLIGSANMDRRSFELNYENNILLQDETLTRQMQERQNAYLAASREVTIDSVQAWPRARRLWQNGLAILGPLL